MDSSSKTYASFFLRFLAVAFDWIIIVLSIYIFRKILILFVPSNSLIFSLLSIVSYFISTAFYNIFFVYKYGGTLGKIFLGLEIVKEDGKISLQDSVKREIILKPLSVLIFGLGIVSMFFNPKKQTFYDKKLSLVVLVKSKLSLIKLIIAIIIGFIYFIYLLSWVGSVYALVNIKNDQDKIELIDEIKQKKDILLTTGNSKETKLAEFAQITESDINKKQQVLCAKQIINVLIRKNICQLEDLDLNNLKQINRLYEDGIKRIVDIQIEVEENMLR